MPSTPLLGAYGSLANTSISFKNVLINGGFDVWQRGTSQTSNGYGSDDRWYNGNIGSTKTSSQQTFTLGQTDVPGNPRYFARTVVTSVAGASNYCVKYQKIEDVRTLAGQTVTLSFWAKADASKNIAVEFEQNFGTGGSPSATVAPISPTTCALTTSWKYFTITTTLPSVSGKTLGTNNNDHLVCLFWFDAGSSFNSFTNSLGQQSGTFDIANVQLESGPIATPFEQRPIGTELALCQRYYEKSFPLEVAPANSTSATAVLQEPNAIRVYAAGSSANDGAFVPYKVTKRSEPVITPFGNNAGVWLRTGNTSAAQTIITSGVNGFCIYQTASVGLEAFRGHFAANAEL